MNRRRVIVMLLAAASFALLTVGNAWAEMSAMPDMDAGCVASCLDSALNSHVFVPTLAVIFAFVLLAVAVFPEFVLVHDACSVPASSAFRDRRKRLFLQKRE